MTFKVLMAMIQSLRGTFTRVDSIIDGLDQRGGDRAEVNALYAVGFQDIITALTSALQDFQTQDLYMCAAQMTFKRALGSTFESTIDIKTVISARSIMDSIIDYKVQPNFDYSRCTELAADIRDKIKTRIPENAKVDEVSS
ncbi:hypothetical protein PHLCEN_2v2097 [Hermanssonia centrifuga]|uniref:Uncharacterized protein n=1 Tax=Hermanssonia centrifuga TaxID=98765 RepID=A0A2R6RQ41_9APHY|nr:hypothetical protein PHLCEN_2v2097 [Hermanssonia centrifuga]